MYIRIIGDLHLTLDQLICTFIQHTLKSHGDMNKHFKGDQIIGKKYKLYPLERDIRQVCGINS